ncbi:MAG TPA: hypothetical protein VGQ46_00890 [Thermoanaerobaculia bacterium]|jgi:hypothetical protein|nr:hypothetical protein [Thermoanaerobaculia bacterium]
MAAMNRAVAVAVCLFLSSSLAASELQSLGAGNMTIRDLVTSLRIARESRPVAASRIKPQIVSVDWAQEAFIIPVVGNLQGSNGTFFRSDVTIANRRAAAQIVSVAFFQRGINNGSSIVQNFSIGANVTTFEPDFVGRILGKTGVLGTLLVVARTATGAIDTAAQIDGFSRIWTPQPGSSGTVSQAFESIDLQDNLPTSYGYGLRQDESFRTNVGLVNLYDTPNTFTVAVVGLRGSNSFTQTVQPYSMEQSSLPAGIYGDCYIRITSSTFNFNWWSAYGTSVDNVTGDGWVSHVH